MKKDKERKKKILIREIYIYGPSTDVSEVPELLYVRKRDERTFVGIVEVVDGLIKILHENKQAVEDGYLTILNTHMYYIFEDGYSVVITTDHRRIEASMFEMLETIKQLLYTYRTSGKITNYTISGDFDNDIEKIVSTLLKVVFLGAGGVGKTTLRKLLFGEIPWMHNPTMSNEAYTDENEEISSYLGTKDSVVIWDIPGQERLRVLWKQSIKDADVIVIVTDSTLENTLESAKFVRFCQANEPSATLVAIANKQDLPKALLPSRVEQILDLKTYAMVAIDPKRRMKVIEIIRKAIFGNGDERD